MPTFRVHAAITALGVAAAIGFAEGAWAALEGPIHVEGEQKCRAGDGDCEGPAPGLPTAGPRDGQPGLPSPVLTLPQPGQGAAQRATPAYALPLLGAYRKTMQIEGEIARACASYGVPVPLARAVCMYESGGDDRLTSGAGAHGYFQVMPATFRLMKVGTNIEAGVKYLGTLLREFGREDDALAGYNGGPGRVKRGRPMPIESLQYVVGVGIYRTLLTREEPEIRSAASGLLLHSVGPGDNWATIAEQTGVPGVNLRLYNPYLAMRPLARGAVVAYPKDAPETIFTAPLTGSMSGPVYVTRRGDNYLLLAFAFDVDLETFRKDNTLWRIQPPFEGMQLLVNARSAGAESVMLGAGGALPGGGLEPIRATVHRVRPGDTLNGIARSYGVSIDALRKANGLKRSHIKPGQVLKLPAA